MAVRQTPEEYAEKWQRRTTQAAPDITKGVNRVTEAPGAKAAAAAQRMLANLTARVNDGTWAAQVGKVTNDEWKKTMIEKGVPRITQGVASAAPKQAAMATKLFSAINATMVEVDRTPRGDLETNIGRAGTFARGMASRALRRPGA